VDGLYCTHKWQFSLVFFKKQKVMKKFNEYNINIIIPKNKKTTTELQEALMEVNKRLFQFKDAYATKGLTQYLISFLEENREYIAIQNYGNIAEEKKQEILETIDSLIEILQNIPYNDYREDEILNAEVMMQKYRVAMYIKHQKNMEEIDDIINLLDLNRVIYSSLENEPIESFKKLQEELLDKIIKKYSIL
jgi:hypothetical protein